MFDDYKAAVVRDYQSKMAEGALSLNLTKPTPARIKKEWLIVFATKTKDDIKTLRLFFGENFNDDEYERAIRKIEVDRFRPLCNFLNNETKNPEDRFIELLAWLIAFLPRPYKSGLTYASDEAGSGETSERHDIIEPLSDSEVTKIYGGSDHLQHSTLRSKKGRGYFLGGLATYGRILLISIAIIIVLLTAASLLKTNSISSILPFVESKECMYWSGVKYIQADCSTTVPNAQLIAFKKDRLDHFQKITRPDTLTLSDINKVWYLKTNHKLELYTVEGVHPEYPERRLRPLSKYMFETYVLTQKVRID